MQTINDNFHGADYVEERDKPRLTKQQARIYNAMLGNGYMTIHDIHMKTGDPHQSIARQLRYIGEIDGVDKNKKHIKDGLYKYKITNETR